MQSNVPFKAVWSGWLHLCFQSQQIMNCGTVFWSLFVVAATIPNSGIRCDAVGQHVFHGKNIVNFESLGHCKQTKMKWGPKLRELIFFLCFTDALASKPHKTQYDPPFLFVQRWCLPFCCLWLLCQCFYLRPFDLLNLFLVVHCAVIYSLPEHLGSQPPPCCYLHSTLREHYCG